MLRPNMLSLNLLGTRSIRKANYLQNVRWAVAVAAEKGPYFTDSALEAAKPFEDIPSMADLPVIGTGWVFLPIIGRYDRLRFMDSMLEKRKLLGDLYRERFGPLNFAVSFSADDLKILYEHEGPYPVRTEIDTIKKYRESRKDWYSTLGVSLLNGPEWLEFRKMTQKHLMKPKAVLAFLNPMQDVARDLVDKIFKERDSANEVPGLLEELYKWSLESISLVGLDSRLGSLQPNAPPDSDGVRMIDSIQTAFECINNLEQITGNVPFYKYFPTPTWKRFTDCLDTFTEIAFKHINRSLDKLKSTPEEERELTLLQSMLLTEGMDASKAMVMVSDMMMAGIDTTSHTVGFFLYNMARNPEKQELLYQHLKEVLPRKEDRITTSLFHELRYLKACVKESQRLNPIAGIQMRTVDHDVVLSGHRIPAGTGLMVVVQALFKDPRYYSNPEEFIPERWLTKDEKFHPFAYLPFGFGTRSCIGRRIAELEILCLTSEIIRNFRVEYHHEDIGMITRLINIPDKPLRVTFIERR